MRRFLTLLSTHATWILAVAIFAALAVPALSAVLGAAMALLVWALLFTSMLRIDRPGLSHVGRSPGVLVAGIAWLLVASPLAAALAVAGLDLPAGVGTAIVLMAAAPPIMGAPALALLLGLDAGLTMAAMIVATLAAPLTIPLVAVGLLGLDLRLDVLAMMTRLSILVGSAAAVAVLVRGWMGESRLAQAASAIDGTLVILLTLFAIAIMDGVPARILDNPLHVLLVTAISFAANAGLQVASALAFAWTGRSRALSLGFAAGNRNMAMLLAILPQGTHPDVVLYFAMAQVPMYMSPALLKPLSRRLLARPAPMHGGRAK